MSEIDDDTRSKRTQRRNPSKKLARVITRASVRMLAVKLLWKLAQATYHEVAEVLRELFADIMSS
ncbi:hypothetical protein [Rhodococcus sp. USK13]|uniref:hypothetical protein n=1 Tax=Rhodococcus sp. USK13 TaxID=2806442 RepID=UPI001BCBD551|nr:hypothetical protein [Rhodococcus sp. USK13]